MAKEKSSGVAYFSKQEFFVVSKTGQKSFWPIGKKQGRFFLWVRRCGQDRMMAGGVKAQNDSSAGGGFNPKALSTDGNATV